MQMKGWGTMSFPLEMVTSSWYGRKQPSASSFSLQRGWDWLAQTVEQGSAGSREHCSAGRGGAVWLKGGSNCPKVPAGPSHLQRAGG